MTLEEAVQRLRDLHRCSAFEFGGYPAVVQIVADKVVVATTEIDSTAPALDVMDIEEARRCIDSLEDLMLEDIVNGKYDNKVAWYIGDNLDRALKEYENYSA